MSAHRETPLVSPTRLRAVPSRRALIGAAAWALPVVTVAATVPAVAASGAALSFSATAYQAPACASIIGATVRADARGSGAPGVAVTLQLSGGFAFDGGSASTTVVTGSDGTAACGDIHVPSGGAVGTITASAAGAASATAALSATPDGRVLFVPRGSVAATEVPAGATPVAGDLFLRDHVLYRHGVGVVQREVAAAGSLVESPAKNGSFLLPLLLVDGSAVVFDTVGNTSTPAVGTPAGATPVAADLFLSGTTLYRGGVAVASGVAAYGQLVEHDQGSGPTGQFELPFRAVDGSPRLYRSPADEVRTAHEFGQAGGPPSGATPVAGDLFIADGTLYRVSADGANPLGTGVLATQIDAWGALTPNPYFSGQRLLPLRTADGSAALLDVAAGHVRTVAQVPPGAVPIGADLFLSAGTVHQADVGAVAFDVGRFGQPVPVAAGASRVAVPVVAPVPTC